MAFFKLLASERAHFEMHEEMISNRDFKERMQKTGRYGVTILAQLIQRGIDMGVLRKVNPEDAAFVLTAAVRGLAFRRIVGSDEFSLPEKADSISDILLDGIRKKSCEEL